jgi:signal transduction histidine kinase
MAVAIYVDDVTATREIEHRLELLHQRTHNAAQVREEIMSIVSQEMRAPLDAVMSCVEQISRKFPIADRWRQTRVLLDSVRRSVERMHHLVSEVSDLAALQTGRLDIQPAQHDVFSLVGDAMRVLQPLAGDRPLRLESDVATGVRVRCDRERIHQVLSGLVQNAIERTPGSEAVTLRVEAVRGHVRFLVRDAGPHEDARGDLPVFDRQWRARRDGHGHGLRLQVAREIVRVHGGEIGVESRLGQGNVSYFTLPCVET